MSRPYRSALYIPASRPRAIDKARGLPADVILFDLEDAVTPSEKAIARATLAEELAKGGFGERLCVVRINAADTEWGAADVEAVAGMDCDVVLIPKVDHPADVDAVAGRLPGKGIWVMMETPRGVLNAAEIADHDRVAGFVVGTNDLAKEMGARHVPDRAPLITALQTCVLAARAHRIVVLDGVYNAFKDDDGLRAECEQGRDFGFDGKTLIHPAQLEIANAAFAPSAEDVALAERQIAAFAEAVAKGEGVAVVDGRIVENLHIETAQATLAKMKAIAEMGE